MPHQQARDARIEPHVADVVGADVHGESQSIARLLPLGALCDGVIQCPSRQPADEAGFFRERDEVYRVEQTARRMLPAEQDLGTRHAAGSELDFRLKEQAQLVVLDGVAEFAQ